jgi:hypothetical protein
MRKNLIPATQITIDISTFSKLTSPSLPPLFTPLNLHNLYESILDRKYEIIHGVSRHPQAEVVSNIEAENLGAEPELLPPVPPTNLSNLLAAFGANQNIPAQLNAPELALTVPSIQENNQIYHPNPNNEPTKAWVLHGFNFPLANQTQNNTNEDELFIGLKSFGF